MKLMVITGMSGAGKSLALDFFEDKGYYCVDNLPPTLIEKFADLCLESNYDRLAVVSDIRGREFFDALAAALNSLDERDLVYEVLFLDASNETLVSRFKETRRKHPLDDEGRLLEAIKKERQLLEELKGRASRVLDTSQFSVQEYRQELERLYYGENGDTYDLGISLISFGFKHGPPLDADIVLDVRFLPNPHYVDSLREKTGKDVEVQKYIYKWPVAEKFYDRLFDFIKFLLPEYEKEGKSHLMIGIGCTGGHHRSVASVLRLKDFLTSQDYRVSVQHRDIDK